MPRKMIIASLALITALSVSAPVFARHGGDDSQIEENSSKVEATVTTAERSVNSGSDDTQKVIEDKKQEQQERIEVRKAELEDRLNKRNNERKEKLEGRRLAVCQNRQDNINALIIKSASIGQAKLARIQSFEDGIKQFHTDQQLSSVSYDATLAVVDAKEAEAIAAIETMSKQSFDCSAVDGADPADTIKAAHTTKQAALKEYRDSVQELLKVVREAFTAKAEEQ